MNTFSITFRNNKKQLETIGITLDFCSVHSVKEWFEDTFDKSARSITKH